MNKTPIELAEIYTRAAFDRTIAITPHGDPDAQSYRLARVGVGDGTWVDNEGVLYVQRNGRFEPHYLIKGLFDKIPEKDFDKEIIVQDPKHPTKTKQVKAYQFGTRSMMVDEEGVLYLVGNYEKLGGLLGKARGSSKGVSARVNHELDYKAHETAKLGYDTSCLKIAREQIELCSLPEEYKAGANARLDQIVQNCQ